MIGYVSEFVFVENERYATLLSWHKSDLLNRLVVEDAAARSRIDSTNIFGVGRSPPVLLLSKINPTLRDNTSLPHTGDLAFITNSVRLCNWADARHMLTWHG